MVRKKWGNLYLKQIIYTVFTLKRSLFSFSKSNCVIQNENVLFKLKRVKMSVSTRICILILNEIMLDIHT